MGQMPPGPLHGIPCAQGGGAEPDRLLLLMTAAPPLIRRLTRPRHLGQVRTGLADMLWNFSNRSPQFLHSYS